MSGYEIAATIAVAVGVLIIVLGFFFAFMWASKPS